MGMHFFNHPVEKLEWEFGKKTLELGDEQIFSYF
jgi:hypothetical protein